MRTLFLFGSKITDAPGVSYLTRMVLSAKMQMGTDGLFRRGTEARGFNRPALVFLFRICSIAFVGTSNRVIRASLER